jgi:predicted Zn-dependent peptidase
LPDVVRLFAEFLGHPKLLDIEVEREVILREIEDELNEFNLSTDIDWQTSNLIWPKFGLGNPIAGTLESVRDLTNEDLIAYRNENYSADRLAIFIAGGQDSETIFSLVDAHFASYPIKGTGQIVNRGAPEPFKGPKFRFVENMDNQYHISLGFVVGGEWSNDEPGYELISRILSDSFSSRLSLRIREQLGLVYDISCDEALLSDFGVMTIQTQITPDKLGVVLKEICEILRTFREGGPTDDEMRKALLRAEVRMSLAAYEPEQLGFRVAWNSLHDRSYSLSARLEKIRSQNGDGLRKLAEKLFCKRNCAVVVIGPKDSELQAEAEGIVRKHLS